MKHLIIVLSLIGWMAMAEEPVMKKEGIVTKKSIAVKPVVGQKVAVSQKKAPALQKASSKTAMANKTGPAIPQKAVGKKVAVSQKKAPALQKASLKTVVRKTSAIPTQVSPGAVQKISAEKVENPSAPALSSALKEANYKTTAYSSVGSGRSTTGFFSFSLGHEALPLRYFQYDSTTINFRYGGYFSEQHGFEAGIKWSMGDNLLIMLKYNYDFTQDQKWVPGLDISVLVGGFGFYKGYEYEYENTKWLNVGLEIGPYIKTFISRSHALFLRTGLAYDTSRLHDNPYIADELRFYINLGIQWHF